MKRYWVPSTASSALFGSDLADYWFPVGQGGDIPFLYGALKHLIETGRIDRAFVDAHTNDWPELEARARSLDWAELEKGAGLPRASIIEFAELIGNARTGVFVWSMGITQHEWGADNVRMILNLALARGFLGRDKCGVMPIRGHSSVQGGAEMARIRRLSPAARPSTPRMPPHSPRTTVSPCQTGRASRQPKWSRPLIAAISMHST